MLAAQQSQGFFSDWVIMVMYGALIIFFMYKAIKSRMVSKNAKGEIHKFKRLISKPMIILGILILIFGVYSIFTGQIPIGIGMIGLVVAMVLELTTPHVLATNGLVLDSKWVEWKDVKKWSIDAERGEMVVAYKQDFDTKNGYIKYNPKDSTGLDASIKKFKLNK